MEELVIQMPKVKPDPKVDADDPYCDWFESQAVLRQCANYLQKSWLVTDLLLQKPLADTIEFGKTNWPYLMPFRNGYHMLQKDKNLLPCMGASDLP